MEKLLKVENLNVIYPRFRLKDINFSCKDGEIIGLIGANGAGKSTTIKAIMGMIKKDSGNIFWQNKLLNDKDFPKVREEIGYVGDKECYYPNVKVKNILKIVSGFYSNWDFKIMDEYIDKFNLDTSKKMKELSTGMRVKLDLLIAMSHNAKLYLLDEPTSGLDPIVRKEIIAILGTLAKEKGKTLIVSTHITSDLEEVADKAMYMVDGKIAVQDTIENIRKNYVKIEKLTEYKIEGTNDYLIIDRGIITTKKVYDEFFAAEKHFRKIPIKLDDILFYERAREEL